MTDRDGSLATRFDKSAAFIHLGLGGRAELLEGFSWDPAYLEAYSARTEPDGPDGRLVSLLAHEADWTGWERHPAGDELVFVISGRMTVIYDLEGAEHRVDLGPLEGVINPAGTWHTADVAEAGTALYVTPGRATEHRAR